MSKNGLMYCAHCGGEAKSEALGAGSKHWQRIACATERCGVATPYCATWAIAAILWNRRLKRKPAKRATRG